ncbi:MAG: helix-turn-helix domain-containing protein [Terriglobales bacterium]
MEYTRTGLYKTGGRGAALKPAEYKKQYRILLEKLRLARHQAKLTQAEAATAIGKPQSFISKCESGERKIDVVELSELAGLYDKDMDFFIARSNRRRSA